jgi:hypothetical protein
MTTSTSNASYPLDSYGPTPAIPNGSADYLFTDGNTNAAKDVGGSIVTFASGAGIYFLTTAITANTTTTTAPAGSFGMTTNATGLGKLFYSDGTKWQYGAVS